MVRTVVGHVEGLALGAARVGELLRERVQAHRVVHAQVGDVIDRMQYPVPPHNAPAELPALDPKSVSSGLSALVNRLGLRWPGQWS